MQLQRELPFAMQLPLLQIFDRHEAPFTIRIPQSGWLHEVELGEEHGHLHGPVRNTFRRTNRWSRALRDQDELALEGVDDKVTHVLFSPLPDDVGLYDKPMARNVQLWTTDFRRLLDGPNATRAELEQARHMVLHCDDKHRKLGYRFQYPAMRVGVHEVYWHRPLVAFLAPESGHAQLIADAPMGYFTLYPAEKPDLSQPLELSPLLMQREIHTEAVQTLRQCDPQKQPRRLPLNVHKLLDAHEYLGGGPLLRSFARQLLTVPKQTSLDDWLGALTGNFDDLGTRIAEGILQFLQSEDPPLPKPLTFAQTSNRSFEVNYWRTIAFLADGKYLTKNNADCVRDTITQHFLPHHHRDLDSLGDYLLDNYRKLVRKLNMTDKAVVGDLPFHWETEWDYDWWGGWLGNRDGKAEERDLIVIIPGRDRSRAVIMADHYDTAYMADIYEPTDPTMHREAGARIPAAGADDNHSATAALMLGAPIFMKLSRDGKLDCDIWLIHLTGEEFPADCLGARKLTQWLVEGNLKARLEDGTRLDLSATRVQGVYVLDMIAHNNDNDRDIFQIAPGASAASMWLALQAHLANAIWNQKVNTWNRRPARHNKGRGHRNLHGSAVPHVAEHLALHGEVRPAVDPRSTLYNTDGQIFSDAGVPVVLFMENYDINRTGYHDTHDTMANIDLDYGAALAAITIETVARAATMTPDV
jgi:hypothetical protein